MRLAIGVITRDQKIDIARISGTSPIRPHDFNLKLWIDGEGFGADDIVDRFAFVAWDADLQIIVQVQPDLNQNQPGSIHAHLLPFCQFKPSRTKILDTPRALLVKLVGSCFA